MCVRTEYVISCCRMRDSLYFDVQHEYVLKKLNFDLLTPPVETGDLRIRTRLVLYEALPFCKL